MRWGSQFKGVRRQVEDQVASSRARASTIGILVTRRPASLIPEWSRYAVHWLVRYPFSPPRSLSASVYIAHAQRLSVHYCVSCIKDIRKNTDSESTAYIYPRISAPKPTPAFLDSASTLPRQICYGRPGGNRRKAIG